MKRIINNQTLEVLRKSVLNTIANASPHIQAAKEHQLKTVSQKFTNLNNWYMRITGLDKVILAQEKVTALQNQLLQIQDKRREVGRHLSEVRQKSIELQDEIHKVKRQDNLEMFLDLMKKETEILKLEQSVSKTFQEYDQAERELFTAFTDSIRDSHEKQRAQMEYTKYFGIILSITGSFLAFVYSTLKKDQLKHMIDERLQLVNKEILSDFANVVSTKLSQLPKSTVEFMPFRETETNNDKIINYVVIFGAIIGLSLLLGKLVSG